MTKFGDHYPCASFRLGEDAVMVVQGPPIDTFWPKFIELLGTHELTGAVIPAEDECGRVEVKLVLDQKGGE